MKKSVPCHRELSPSTGTECSFLKVLKGGSSAEFVVMRSACYSGVAIRKFLPCHFASKSLTSVTFPEASAATKLVIIYRALYTTSSAPMYGRSRERGHICTDTPKNET